MPMMSFETLANVVAIAVLVILAVIYVYGKRHFESGSDSDQNPRHGRP